MDMRAIPSAGEPFELADGQIVNLRLNFGLLYKLKSTDRAAYNRFYAAYGPADEEDYNYCKAKGILEPHRELTPFTYDQSKWTRDYWAQLKVDLVENFSDERMSHMRQVAKVYLADKIKRLEQEEQARLEERKKQLEEENKRIAAQQAAQAERVAQAKVKPQAAAQAKPQAAAQTQPTENVTPKSGRSAEQDRRLEEKKKQLEEENKRIAAQQAAQARQLEERKKQLDEGNKKVTDHQAAQAERVAQAKAKGQDSVQTQSTQGRKTTSKEANPPKKVIGVVAITIVVIGIVLFLILGHNPN